MPRYLIRIGQDSQAHRYTERSVLAVFPRAAMTKAHTALLNARRHTLEGKDFDYWTVYEYELEGRRYKHVHTYKMP